MSQTDKNTNQTNNQTTKKPLFYKQKTTTNTKKTFIYKHFFKTQHAKHAIYGSKNTKNKTHNTKNHYKQRKILQTQTKKTHNLSHKQPPHAQSLRIRKERAALYSLEGFCSRVCVCLCVLHARVTRACVRARVFKRLSPGF